MRLLLFSNIVTFMVKYPGFTNDAYMEVINIKETFIYPSIWQYDQEHKIIIRRKHFVKLLLLLAGDIETFPGPVRTRYTCTSCMNTLRKNQKVEKCKNCKGNFHLICLYDVYEHNMEKFYCSFS